MAKDCSIEQYAHFNSLNHKRMLSSSPFQIQTKSEFIAIVLFCRTIEQAHMCLAHTHAHTHTHTNTHYPQAAPKSHFTVLWWKRDSWVGFTFKSDTIPTTQITQAFAIAVAVWWELPPGDWNHHGLHANNLSLVMSYKLQYFFSQTPVLKVLLPAVNF